MIAVGAEKSQVSSTILNLLKTKMLQTTNIDVV